MNNSCSLVMTRGAGLIIAIVVLTISAPSARAQGAPGPTSNHGRSLRDREMQITLLERGAKESPKREPRLLLQEINEDFSRLQVVKNEMMLKSSREIVLDFKYVSDAAAEIKKRSSRLRTNLAFPETAEADKEEKTSPTEGLKSQLIKLDRLIRSFVTNPVFTDANVINAELAAKARRDLDEIIDLSDKVKKLAAKLNDAKTSH